MPSSPRIDPTLRRVLFAFEGVAFTRTELLENYRARYVEHGRDSRASRQFIDRNLIRLSKAGILQIQEVGEDQDRSYLFRTGSSTMASSTEPDALGVLRQKLQQQRIELLTTLGETEVYDEVCNDLPELQVDVQAHYNDARDRSVKLLGRIRALESLISTRESGAA